ncbi:LPS export ABC transporter periplasmic protein LptC [Parerythrobacter aurantius]|uniref:LPS export ABC transporter periplasmic protein LptC n=1 Tax=Parerythrobacter aurantius TaxID=3127706 RepID=UPI003251E7FA
MNHAPRIETLDAKELRRGRQAFAAPGGFHDTLVKFLGTTLPIGVGVVAALMVITPLSPRGEISFLLDRDEVAQIDERLRVDNALYRGTDSQGRPFSLTANEAVQRSSAEGVVRLQDVVARILLSDGPGQLTAEGGTYSIADEVLQVTGPLMVTAADGYRFVASGVAIDLENKRLTGSDGVEGAIPAGTFSADRLEADLDARIVALDGNARLRMVPGQVNQSMRMPR